MVTIGPYKIFNTGNKDLFFLMAPTAMKHGNRSEFFVFFKVAL